jgi:alpha-L-fucosidase
VVVNDRWGKETRSQHGDYYTTEYDLVHNNKGIGAKADHPWEESRGIGTSYGYNQFETTEHYLTSKQLIHMLIDKVSNGGNFLLNVGPDANGLIPVIMQERLLDIGGWLNVNGEAIYATKAWRAENKPENENIVFTQKEGNLYVIIKKWQEEPIVLPTVKSTGKVELLGYKSDINVKLENGDLVIISPTISINELPCEHAWVFKVNNFME